MKKKSLQLVISEKPQRVDLAIIESLRSLQTEKQQTISRTSLKAILRSDPPLLSGKTLSLSEILLPGNYEIQISEEVMNFNRQATPADEGFQVPILYEDENLLIVHKPSGIPSAPLKAIETQTAVNFVLRLYPHLNGIGRGHLESGLLHRLDTGTSGALVFAKTQNEFERLHELWKKRKVQKTYRVIVQPLILNDVPKFFPFTIRYPLAHDVQKAKKMLALAPQVSHLNLKNRIRGKLLPAITHILSCHPCKNELWWDFDVQIETGVMHQIRCHLATLGWPILGDSIYRGAPADRLWLHAWKIRFPLASEKLLTVEAPLPENWPAF